MATRKSTMQPVARLGWEQVLGWRLRRQWLDRRASVEEVLQVASDIRGLHAQVLSSAELTLWARIDGLKAGELGRLLWEDRSLVKTWAMRGTLHLLPSAEYPIWQAALDTRRQYIKSVWLRNFGISSEEHEQLLAAVSEALSSGMLTREELAGEVERLTGSPDQAERVRGSWGAYLKPAAYRGQLCFGPAAGQNVRFARPDLWLGDWQRVDSATALAEVTRRYLSAYGPATREDVARWWGVTPPEAGAMLKALGDEIAAVDVGGASMWLLSKDLGEIGIRFAARFGEVAAGLRPVRGRHISGRVPRLARRPQGSSIPTPGLALSGIAGRWPHGRGLAPREEGQEARGHHRTLPTTAPEGAAGRGGRGAAAGRLHGVRPGAWLAAVDQSFRKRSGGEAMSYRIAVIPGDNIGPEVVREALKVLRKLQQLGYGPFEFEEYPWGAGYYLQTGAGNAGRRDRNLRGFDAIYFGAHGDPARVPDRVTSQGLMHRIRKSFDLYANVRPIRLLRVVSPIRDKTEMDFVVVRENSEGEYSGAGAVSMRALRWRWRSRYRSSPARAPRG